MYIADSVRQCGAEVGDVVEVVMSPGWLSGIISEVINEKPAWREGLLIEVSAIGEQHILGFALQGESSLSEGKTYKDFEWVRIDSPVRDKKKDKETQILADAIAVADDAGNQALAKELNGLAEKIERDATTPEREPARERLFTRVQPCPRSVSFSLRMASAS